MPFPASERVVYANNPLHEVVCQLRFPTILQITAAEPAAFQDRVRASYPFYRRESGLRLVRDLTAILNNPQTPWLEENMHWFLKDDTDTVTRISLANDFVAVTVGEGKYQRWEEFKHDINLAREAVEGVYSPVFYSRVGLRYRDLIERSSLGLAEVPWNELLSEHLAGLLASRDVGADVQGFKTEALLEMPEGFARLNHGLVNRSSPGAPSDMAYLLDIDFYVEGRKEPHDVAGILDTFNRMAGDFFRWAITPRLSDALGPRKMDD
jgi:uncharacterized protein (TIGR04255 family)